jgi:hypothetical protein
VKTFARITNVCWLLASVVFLYAAEPRVVPLMRAHSHNDYEQRRPLAEALSRGFWSVEADVWLHQGRMLVAHDFVDVSPEKTLQSLYLNPLRGFFKTNATPKSAPPLTLLIDVKSAAEPTYAALRDVLTNYADILTRFESNTIHTNAVMVIISGERAPSLMAAEPSRFAAVDGRLPDLATNPPVALMPLISDNWTKQFKWRGTGALPDDERAKLRALVQQTHSQGRRLRLWAAPDNETGWKELYEAGVDLLNTDHLEEMRTFFSQR